MNISHGVAGGTTLAGVIVSFCAQNLPVVQFLAAVIAIVVGLPHAVRIVKYYYQKWFGKQ